MSSAEEVVARMESVDRAKRDGDPVREEDLSINISDLYHRYKWVSPGPIPRDGQERLQVSDRTNDKRWAAFFVGKKNFVGIYRSFNGFYWLLRYETGFGAHYLDHIGTAHDTAKRFGGK